MATPHPPSHRRVLAPLIVVQATHGRRGGHPAALALPTPAHSAGSSHVGRGNPSGFGSGCGQVVENGHGGVDARLGGGALKALGGGTAAAGWQEKSHSMSALPHPPPPP